MDNHLIQQAIDFAESIDNYSIAIGGGEPTLHPQFFDILKRSLQVFDNVWLATNGSQTEIMYRLANIIDDVDYDSFECECTPEDLEEYGCECDHDYIESNGNLAVALSQDIFHSAIDNNIIELWKRRASVHGHSHFEIRNTYSSYNSIAGQGRAKKNGYDGKHCVCSDIIIKSDGKVRLCGCTRSPIIGNIWDGISDEWQEKMNDERYTNGERCYKDFKKK